MTTSKRLAIPLDGFPFGFSADDTARNLPEWLRIVADMLEEHQRDRFKTGHVEIVRHLARVIGAQTQPPRIPEPGLWGVVEAHTAGNPKRFRFGRTQPNAWVKQGTATRWDWDELIDPVLIREGVSDE